MLDWIQTQLQKHDHIVGLQKVGDRTLLIERDPALNTDLRTYPPIAATFLTTPHISGDAVRQALEDGTETDFVCSVPKDAIWHGAAIAHVESVGLGWGGYGTLLSAIVSDGTARGFEKKEYQFAMRGLRQHSKVQSVEREFDRLVKVTTARGSHSIVFLEEYELTAERVRHAHEIYGSFNLVLRTNPNGEATQNAHDVAGELGARILQHGELLSFLRTN